MIQQSGVPAPALRPFSSIAVVAILVTLPLFAAVPRRAAAPPSPVSPDKVKAPVCVPAAITAPATSSPLWIPMSGSSTLSVDVTGTNAAVSWYTWGDEKLVGTGKSISVSPTTHTCYYAVVRNECGLQESLGAWVMICTPVITQNPTASPSSIVPGEAATLEAGGGTGQGSLTYKWFTNDGTFIGTGKKLVVRPRVTTTYYYKLCNAWESDPSVPITVTVR